jgi:hypothetical protein
VGDVRIKFEIVAEARIRLGPPEFHEWSDVPCLNFADACAEKLLSNTDRWADAATKSRDLMDLAFLRRQSEIPELSFNKADAAYPVKASLIKAIKNFQKEASYRDKCFSALRVLDRDRAKVIDGVDLLAADFNIPLTKRNEDEIMPC